MCTTQIDNIGMIIIIVCDSRPLTQYCEQKNFPYCTSLHKQHRPQKRTLSQNNTGQVFTYLRQRTKNVRPLNHKCPRLHNIISHLLPTKAAAQKNGPLEPNPKVFISLM